MPSQRVEMLRTGFEAWNRGDIDAVVALAAPEYEWHTSGTFPDFDPVYYGPDGLRKFSAEMQEAWEYIEAEPGHIWEIGDRVVASFRFHAKGRESGVVVDRDWTNVFTFNEDDRIVHGVAYPSLDAALAGEGIPRDAVPPEPAPDPE